MDHLTFATILVIAGAVTVLITKPKGEPAPVTAQVVATNEAETARAPSSVLPQLLKVLGFVIIRICFTIIRYLFHYIIQSVRRLCLRKKMENVERNEMLWRMRENGISWGDIGYIVQANPDTLRRQLSRYAQIRNLPPKIVIKKRKTDGAMGLKIKEIRKNDLDYPSGTSDPR